MSELVVSVAGGFAVGIYFDSWRMQLTEKAYGPMARAVNQGGYGVNMDYLNYLGLLTLVGVVVPWSLLFYVALQKFDHENGTEGDRN
ncbi:hypothetical protein [Halopiger thermotolerans]